MCYDKGMKRRRTISPKTVRNRSALIKFVLLALAVAVVGSGLTYLSWGLMRPQSAPEEGEQVAQASVLSFVPGLLFMLTLVGTLALVFFEARAYLQGTKARASLQNARMKVKRS